MQLYFKNVIFKHVLLTIIMNIFLEFGLMWMPQNDKST